eukprot:1157653-Pelagomonas_calceolata.AAC.14
MQQTLINAESCHESGKLRVLYGFGRSCASFGLRYRTCSRKHCQFPYLHEHAYGTQKHPSDLVPGKFTFGNGCQAEKVMQP